MPTWPPSIDENMLAPSYAPVPPELVARTEMEGGAAYTRGKATAGPTTFPGVQRPLTRAQMDTFQTFWRDEIKNGALAFDFNVPADWPVPESGTTQKFRIIGVYRVRALQRGTRWLLELDMEMIP